LLARDDDRRVRSIVKLDELLRRQDVCFFCGYTIGIAGVTKCPECGKERPTAEEIERVRGAARLGWIGAAILASALVLLVCVATYATLGTTDPFGILAVFFSVFHSAIIVVLHVPWLRSIRRPFDLFRHPWRRRLVASYPWVWMLLHGVFITLLSLAE